MKRYRALFRLILIVLGLCLSLNACDGCHDSGHDNGLSGDGTLSGVVQDADSGLPISGASVEVYDGATLVVEATTDGDGAYSVELAAGGGYSVDAGATGYVSTSQNDVIVEADETTVLDFELSTAGDGTGIVQGVVRDAVTSNGINGATIEIYDGATLLATTSSNANGNYSVAVLAGQNYEVSVSSTGFIPASYFDVDLEENETVILESILQIADTYSGNGTIAGTITDSLTGTGLTGVTLTLRDGLNMCSGASVATGTTIGDGTYSIADVPTGYYTAELSKAGYITAYISVYSLGGETTGNQNASLSPELSVGETRIVLTWGSAPGDLDSHLTAPTTSGPRFHLYYAAPAVDDGTVADLDADDTTSYGPETITISTQIDGVYRYYVHDFTNDGANPSTVLSNSGAQVKVYQSGGLVATYNIPSNQGGTIWAVFELSGTTLTPVNTFSYDTSGLE